MCECGCGDMNAIVSFEIGNNILIVDEYLGCDDCDTPLGIVLHLMDKKEAENWVEKSSIKSFRHDESREEGNGARYFSFIGKNELVAAAEEMDKEFESHPFSDYSCLADFMQDYGLELLQKAMNKRRK
jgi:hypothetical protein